MAEINLERAMEDAKAESSGDQGKERVSTAKRKPPMKRSRGGARHMLKTFIEEDGRNAIDYIIWSIVKPNLKALIHDILDKGSARVLWGNDYQTSTYNSPSPYGNHYTNYTKASEQKQYQPDYRRRTAHNSYFVDDIYVETLSEVEEIEARLSYLNRNKGYALVSDFYEAAGLESNYIDQHWGWYNLAGIKKIRGKDGVWIISMPFPVEIDDR